MELSGYLYHCVAGETWDSVSLQLYGHERYASELLAANPALCRKVIFTGGEKLKVPVVTVPDTNAETAYTPAAAPWKT